MKYVNNTRYSLEPIKFIYILAHFNTVTVNFNSILLINNITENERTEQTIRLDGPHSGKTLNTENNCADQEP